MKLIAIFVKTLIWDFYTENIQVFFIAAGFILGFMRFADHLMFAKMVVSQPLNTIYLLGLWLFYAVAVVHFVKKKGKEHAYEVLSDFPLFPIRLKFITMVIVASLLYAPVILYALFVISVAVSLQNYFAGLVLLFGVTLMIGMGSIAINYMFQIPRGKSVFLGLPVGISPKSPVLWASEGELRFRPFPYVFIKCVTLAILFTVKEVFIFEGGINKIWYLGMIVAFVPNMIFPYSILEFENETFITIRNLPIRIRSIAWKHLVSLVVLCLPELIFVLAGVEIKLGVELIAQGLSMLMIITSIQILGRFDLSGYLRMIFIASLSIFIVTLMNITIWGQVLVMGMVVFTIYRGYYRFLPG